MTQTILFLFLHVRRQTQRCDCVCERSRRRERPELVAPELWLVVRVYYGDDLYIRSPSRAHRPHRAHKTRAPPQSQKTTTHADDTLTYSKDDNKTLRDIA